MSQLHIAAPHLTAPFILLDAASAAAAAWTTRRPSQGALCKGKFAGHPALSSSAYRIFYLGPLPLQTRLNPVLRIAHRGCPNWRHITGRSLCMSGPFVCQVSVCQSGHTPQQPTHRNATRYDSRVHLFVGYESGGNYSGTRSFCLPSSELLQFGQSCAKTVRAVLRKDGPNRHINGCKN